MDVTFHTHYRPQHYLYLCDKLHAPTTFPIRPRMKVLQDVKICPYIIDLTDGSLWPSSRSSHSDKRWIWVLIVPRVVLHLMTKIKIQVLQPRIETKSSNCDQSLYWLTCHGSFPVQIVTAILYGPWESIKITNLRRPGTKLTAEMCKLAEVIKCSNCQQQVLPQDRNYKEASLLSSFLASLLMPD